MGNCEFYRIVTPYGSSAFSPSSEKSQICPRNGLTVRSNNESIKCLIPHDLEDLNYSSNIKQENFPKSNFPTGKTQLGKYYGVDKMNDLLCTS